VLKINGPFLYVVDADAVELIASMPKLLKRRIPIFFYSNKHKPIPFTSVTERGSVFNVDRDVELRESAGIEGQGIGASRRTCNSDPALIIQKWKSV